LSDEVFCASDVAFHRALVDSAANPIISYQLAGAVEAMQPLMNMITFTERNRERIIELHTEIADGLENHDAERTQTAIDALAAYTMDLARVATARRQGKQSSLKGD